MILFDFVNNNFLFSYWFSVNLFDFCFIFQANSIMNTLKFALIVGLPHTETFGYLISASYTMAILGAICFVIYVLRNKRKWYAILCFSNEVYVMLWNVKCLHWLKCNNLFHYIQQSIPIRTRLSMIYLKSPIEWVCSFGKWRFAPACDCSLVRTNAKG